MRQVSCIGGGTTEMARNVISERVLGMPGSARSTGTCRSATCPRGAASSRAVTLRWPGASESVTAAELPIRPATHWRVPCPHRGRPWADWFEELKPGLVIDHAVTRTITEADNTLFSVLTMNPQPLHLDESFAATTEFGSRIVNSLFTLSLLIGLSVFETTLGTTVANLGFGEIAFPAPVFPGDSIHGQTEVISARRLGVTPGPGHRRVRAPGVQPAGRAGGPLPALGAHDAPPTDVTARVAEHAVRPGQPARSGRQGTRDPSPTWWCSTWRTRCPPAAKARGPRHRRREQPPTWWHRWPCASGSTHRRTPWFADDVASLADGRRPPWSCPSWSRPTKLAEVAEALGGRPVVAGLETVRGVVDARDVLGAPVVACYFGAEDYVADLGGVRTASNAEVATARA